MRLKVILEEGDDGYIVASVPSLQGCFSQGKTKQEALKNIREAVELYLEPDPADIKYSKQHHHQVLTMTV